MDFLNYKELRLVARRHLSRGIFEYIDRGSEDENALRRNRQALEALKVVPRVLIGGGRRSQATCLFGQEMAAPIIVAPTAFAGLAWYRGEVELAKAAAANRIPFCAATVAITSLEETRQAVGDPVWFQVQVWEKEKLTHELVQRAWDMGVRTLLVTVDSGSAGANREYNVRNGFDLPFRFSPEI